MNLKFQVNGDSSAIFDNELLWRKEIIAEYQLGPKPFALQAIRRVKMKSVFYDISGIFSSIKMFFITM